MIQQWKYRCTILLLLAIGCAWFGTPITPRYQQQVAAASTTHDVSHEEGKPHATLLLPEGIPLANNADNGGSVNDIHDATVVTLQHNGTTKGYHSPTVKEETPFTHMLITSASTQPRTAAAVQPGALVQRNGLQIEVRVSADAFGDVWSNWMAVSEDDELWQPDDGDTVSWSNIVAVGDALRWQLRTIAHDTTPDVRSIAVHTVNAHNSDDTTSDPRPLPAHESSFATGLNSIEKPPFVSRRGWGCPDGSGTRVTPAYRYVTHMIIHHTAGSNSLPANTTWADTVRAIWSFHTYTRDWGDIGYNYLIAPDGTIFEGRGGGDNAVGFHDTANYGSMGVSLLGTYDTVLPTPMAQESLVALLAWKAVDNDIAPHGQSYYHGCSISPYCRAYTPNAIMNTIAGHRDVTPNYTSCPGNQLAQLLPSIRDSVQAYINDGGGGTTTTPDNGDLVIEELEDSFTKSDAQWYQAACGDGGHTYYTYATDDETDSTNNAMWKPVAPLNGSYRVYVHVPQMCGLATPPYAATNAVYTVHTADGTFSVSVDHNTAEEWVDIGTFRFAPGADAFVTLDDLTGEAYDLHHVLFFDSVKWVEATAPVAPGIVELLDVTYDKTTIAAGELLTMHATVRNGSERTLETQNPQATLLHNGTFDATGGYVYDEHECMLGDEKKTYAAYPKEIDRFRVTLGATNRTVACAGNDGGYPWRWGMNGSLAPGETRIITGYVYFHTPGDVTVRAGLIQEYVKYYAQDVAPTTIHITQEQQSPTVMRYNEALQPMAQVYHVDDVPDNFLARTGSPLAVHRGDSVGSFAWDGTTQTWQDGGPLGVQDRFVVEQTRAFTVSVAGEYTFRASSQGNAWLWVDGNEVVFNNGLMYPPDMTRHATGTLTLAPGYHVLSFRYVQLSDSAMAGYAIMSPHATTFVSPTDALHSQSISIGNTFTSTPTIVLAADDQGGSGLLSIHYSWDGGASWQIVPVMGTDDTPVGLIPVVPTGVGIHQLHYKGVDKAGNSSAVETVQFVVQTAQQRVYLPVLMYAPSGRNPYPEP